MTQLSPNVGVRSSKHISTPKNWPSLRKMGHHGPEKESSGANLHCSPFWVRGDPFSKGEDQFFGVKMHLELRSPMFGESCVMIFIVDTQWN